MDIKHIQGTVTKYLNKYKYAVLVVLIGITLMLIPTRSKTDTASNEEPKTTVTAECLVQEELEKILSYIQGAGSVKVMLKEATGVETVYQTNQDISVSENSSTTKIQVITVTDSNRNEVGLIKQINPSKYQGAIILCQGADDPVVKLAVTDAVSKITGLGADKIAVLKMK